MKKFFILSCLSCLVVLSSTAQDYDRQVLSEEDIVGTARYTAMAGAFTAVGGDVSAALDNPAALGIFRRGEVSVSFSGAFQTVASDYSTEPAYTGDMPQLSWVIHFAPAGRENGLLRHSLMLQYHNVTDFKRSMQASGNIPSLTLLMADRTAGLSEEAFQTDNFWWNPDIGWLSSAAWLDSLILPSSSDPTLWEPALRVGDNVPALISMRESGTVNDYSLSWGGNLNDRFYIGAGLGVRTLSYSRQTDYAERFGRGGNLQMTSAFYAKGAGVRATIGAIYRPVNAFRVGVSFQSPSWMTLKMSNTTDLESYGGTYGVSSPVNTYTFTNYLLPMKLTAGVAWVFGVHGLLSLEYDWTHQPGTLIDDRHMLKAGAEWAVLPVLFLRAGYAFRSSFVQDDFVRLPDLTAWYTDVETLSVRRTHYASCGIGYRSSSWIVDLSYQCRVQPMHLYAHAFQSDPFSVRSLTHALVISLGWTSRR